MGHRENGEVNRDTFRRVKPEQPIEEPVFLDSHPTTPENGGRCIFIFAVAVLGGLSFIGTMGYLIT